MASNRTTAPTATHYLWLALALLALTVYGSLIPLRYRPMPLDEAWTRFRGLHASDPALVSARGDWVVNAVQFATVSFCFLGASCVDRRPTLGLWVALVLVPLGGLAAVLLEFVQVFFPPRTVSLNDLAVEWAGVVVGAGTWLLIGQRGTDWLRRFWGRKGLDGLATQLFPAYVLLLLIVHLMPFDVIVGRDELARKYDEGRIQLVPFGDLPVHGLPSVVGQLANVAAFAPLGVLVAWIPRWSGLGRLAVLGLGLGVTLTVEVLQLLVYTRYCDATDVLTGAGAVLLGWWSARTGRDALRARRIGVRGALGRWGPIVGRAAFGVWVGVLVLANWQPFHFTTVAAEFRGSDPESTDEDTPPFGLRRMAWAPLVDYYWGSRYDALDQFVRRSLSFVPLGILLALRPGRRERPGARVTVLVALALGVVIETGQYFIPERHPGTTDVLIETLGAWLGFALTRHVARALEPDEEARGEVRYAYRVGIGATPVGTAAGIRTGSGSGMEPGGPSAAPRRRSRTGTTAGPGGSRPGTGRRALVTRFFPIAQKLREQIAILLAWFDARPYGLQVVIICAAAVVLTLVFVSFHSG